MRLGDLVDCRVVRFAVRTDRATRLAYPLTHRAINVRSLAALDLEATARLCRDGCDQAGLVSHNHKLRPVPSVELGEQPADVCLDGSSAQLQMAFDLAV